ncbi:MAG: hypothetical protein ACLTHL_08175 [Collinsella sp.]
MVGDNSGRQVDDDSPFDRLAGMWTIASWPIGSAMPIARRGYKSSAPSLSSSAAEFKFDDQDSVRKTLEELHSGQGQDDYFGQYFQSHVDLASVQESLKRYFSECIDALESKARFNDARARIDNDEILSCSIPAEIR